MFIFVGVSIEAVETLFRRPEVDGINRWTTASGAQKSDWFLDDAALDQLTGFEDFCLYGSNRTLAIFNKSKVELNFQILVLTFSFFRSL